MSKIFGYTKKGGKDWFSSDSYSDKEIEAIIDPEGGSEISLPTAIPSPFARIDLVKTAFRNISKTQDLKAYSINSNVVASKDDEKLVSEALDLSEMLFNIDSISDEIKIIVWDREAEIAILKNTSEMHRRFAETLELYLEQDKTSYNFDLLKRFYLIEYDHKIIGCTSPATLFFATANDLKHAQIRLTKNDVTFDEQYTPLYERDVDFQRFIYLLFKANAILSQRMPELLEYLKKNLLKLDTTNPQLYAELNKLNGASYISNYSELDTGTTGDVVEVIGVPLRKRKKGGVDPVKSSDFIIQSSIYKGRLMPLALQNSLNKPFRYANDKWDNTIKVPYADSETVLEKRRLPGLKIQYPYLTVSDFLEPYLIRLVYPINKEIFFDGNVNTDVGNDSKGFILPIKRQFFDYFTSDDLVSSLPGKPRIEMVQLPANAVKVILSIPIAKEGESITFERVYYQTADSHPSKPDEENNRGIIVEHQFGLTLFPFIKTNNPNIKAFYRVQLVDRDVIGVLKNTEYDLNFYSNSQKDEVEVKAKKTRSKKRPDAGETATSQYYVLDNEFDYIQIRNIIVSGASGIIIPRWDKQTFKQGNSEFSFAVDFGTTNTHIEYKIGDTVKPFDITQDDIQIATLFHPTKTTGDFGGSGAVAIKDLIEHEFIPQKIGEHSAYKFPHRTVLAENSFLNIQHETFALADFNIPFIYGYIPDRDEIHTNLKWARKEMGNEKRVRAYFEIIIMMMRNKVLLRGGDLTKTRLIWFYPSSMKQKRKSSLNKTWEEFFNLYFKPSKPAIGITESLAPYFYFKAENRIQGGSYKPVISIDIGGGTTDILVIQKEIPIFLTSFKFSANTIFGDGYSEYGATNSNGLVKKYSNYYQEILAVNKLYDLQKVLSNVLEKNKSDDVNAFFFSIENNPRIKDKKHFSYNSLLAKDEDMNIVFVYFYTAIIYHIASLMKVKGTELPKHIIFSGTGSKILSIVSSDIDVLCDLTKKIFESVYGELFDEDGLKIENEKEIPKEVTCKGGLKSNPDELQRINGLIKKEILTCIKGVDKLTYDLLDDKNFNDIVVFVKNFNNYFIQLSSDFKFTDNFNISENSLQIFKKEVNKHLRGYLEEGVKYNKRLDEVAADDKEVEETLFFYPLIGTINSLTSQLSELSPVNH